MSIPDIIALLPLVYLVIVAIPLVVIDIQQHRLPNKIVIPFLFLSLVSNILSYGLAGEWITLAASVGFPLAMFILGIVANYYNWIGVGDVKLLTAVMLMVGIYSPVLALWIPLISVACGVLLAVIQMLRKDYGRSVPLGPWILVSTFAMSALALVPAW